MNRKTQISDYTCRAERGGCGREVLLVVDEAPKDFRAFGTMNARSTSRFIAVHAEDAGDCKIVRGKDARRFQRLRAELELKCLARKERAAAESLPAPRARSAAAGKN